MPAEFHFIRPSWLVALPLIAFATWALARRRLRSGNWLQVIDPVLAPYVLATEQVSKNAWRWLLFLLGGVLAVLALAGPSWNRIEQPVFRSEQALVVALDLSRSMDAQDLAPSRLTRARLKILDIIEHRKSGQTALVVYSANAFTVTPLTTDTDTVAALVNSLSTDIMPSRGSYPVAAIDKGKQLLEQAGVRYGEVLLITDGGDSPDARDAAEALAADGYTLSVLGVGTREGAPIPKPDGGFVTDRSGNLAIPKLDASGLNRLAAAGNGRYATLTADDSDVESLLSGEVGARAAGDENQATDQWQEEGPWLLLLLLPLAALAFRRGVVLLLVLAVLPIARPAQAFEWQDLWQTPDQQGQASLAAGDAEAAAGQFDNPAWQAVARYRAGDFSGSTRGFSAAKDAKSLYNLGNSLARMGKFDAAISAYDQALDIDPGNEDASYNRDLVKDLAKKQDAANQNQNKKQQNQNGEQGDGQQSEGSSQSDQSGEQGSDGKPGSEADDGDSARQQQPGSEENMAAMQKELQRAAEEAARQGEKKDPQEGDAQSDAVAMRRQQEQQQALEQWLRRIPNDPGGLLRRKFRYQYQRQGRDQDGNELWPDNEVQPW